MKKKEISITICEYDSLGELSEVDQNLVIKAKEACMSSYSPYSNFKVGAAVELSNGVIVQGSNQENSAYPSGLCAERVALFYAQAAYPKEKVRKVVIAAYSGKEEAYVEAPIPPCGACRQVMFEIEELSDDKIKIILVGEKKIRVIDSVSDLLPLSFDKKFLN